MLRDDEILPVAGGARRVEVKLYDYRKVEEESPKTEVGVVIVYYVLSKKVVRGHIDNILLVYCYIWAGLSVSLTLRPPLSGMFYRTWYY